MNKLPNTMFKKNARRFHSLYINKFMSMKCAPDLLIRRLFPNAKEITESFGAFEATKYLPYSWHDTNVTLIAVGDGVTPRTASTFAFRTRWECYSVDPKLRDKDWQVDRLTCLPTKIEQQTITSCTPVILCCVHSHVKLPVCLKSIVAPKISTIAIPCCVDLTLDAVPDFSYNDENIWSAKNLVKVWCDATCTSRNV